MKKLGKKAKVHENSLSAYCSSACMILSILVYTFFTRMFDFMLPLVVKYSIVAA